MSKTPKNVVMLVVIVCSMVLVSGCGDMFCKKELTYEQQYYQNELSHRKFLGKQKAVLNLEQQDMEWDEKHWEVKAGIAEVRAQRARATADRYAGTTQTNVEKPSLNKRFYGPNAKIDITKADRPKEMHTARSE